MSWKTTVGNRIKRLEKEVVAAWYMARDPATPWYAKALAVVVTAYALSPIDLIPDFIPLLGYLDDLILIPAGIALVIKLVPHEVVESCRKKAEENEKSPISLAGGIVIGLIWICILFFVGRAIYHAILSKK